MNILIVGGAGYIGSHVAREFLDRGHSVTVYDNLSTGTTENLFEGEQFVEGDILDADRLRGCMATGFDALVHLAAAKAAGESMLKPEKYSLQNLNGTVNILNIAAETGIGKIIFSSSAAVYGEPRHLPIDEQHPTEPENYYGFTKLEIERILSWYDRLKGMRYAALRYFNAAGYDPQGRIHGLEKNPANLIPTIMEVAVGLRPELQVFGTDYPTPDGTGVRDYVHVSDLAVGHAAALEWISRNDRSLVVNLGSEKGLSVLEILETARRISGRAIPAKLVDRRPGDPANLYASAALARELLGWEARMSDVETLVRTTWEAYRKHGH
ncbi:MAG TPA: UDP-glucose 4-epimerase GalE [Rectinemataceae bacterium]|nr:UDP-glucose 4-epimerase GalE [Rectinemataceae bacterium]